MDGIDFSHAKSVETGDGQSLTILAFKKLTMAAVLGRALTKLDINGHRNNDGIEYLDDDDRGCLNSSFAGYYIVTISLNAVAILFGIFSQIEFHHSGGYGYNHLDFWYFCNGLFGVLHIMFCFYIVRKIEQPAAGEDAAAMGYHQHGNEGVIHATNVGRTQDQPARAPAWTAYGQPVQQVPQQPRDFLFFTPTTQASTWSRIKQVLLEDRVFACYIVVFLLYLAWHAFTDYNVGYYQHGLRFAQKCTDIFCVAGPASLLFGIGHLLFMRRREQ